MRWEVSGRVTAILLEAASWIYSKQNAAYFIGLVWFYGISAIVGYLMPNPFLYIYVRKSLLPLSRVTQRFPFQ